MIPALLALLFVGTALGVALLRRPLWALVALAANTSVVGGIALTLGATEPALATILVGLAMLIVGPTLLDLRDSPSAEAGSHSRPSLLQRMGSIVGLACLLAVLAGGLVADGPHAQPWSVAAATQAAPVEYRGPDARVLVALGAFVLLGVALASASNNKKGNG